jgi:hypothetical protein
MSKSNEARVPRSYTSRAARLMAEARWKGTTPEERTAIMTEVGKQGGRPRSSNKRCFCGAKTCGAHAAATSTAAAHAGAITLKLKKGQANNYDQEKQPRENTA